MRFLADMGIAQSTVTSVRRMGHEVLHLRDEGLQTLPDSEILLKARRERRVILTFDLDFGDLLATGKDALPSVVILRLRNQTPSRVTPKLLEVLRAEATVLERGSIVMIEEGRYRLRRLPIQGVEEEP